MNIDQTTKIITSRPQSFLDIGIIEGGEKKLIHRKYDASNGNWKKLVSNVFTDFGVPTVFIDIYAPNGSSFKLVQSVTLNNDGSYLQQPQFPMAGLGAAPTQMPDHFTAYVLREKDEKIREREDRILELKDQHKLDQDTIRELREKNWELEKASKFMQKEFELQRAEENLQRENDRKGSLEGIAESVMQNEKLMDIAHALIMSKIQQPQPQQIDASGMGAIENDPNISEGKKQIIKEIASWLKVQHDATASKIYAIFNQLAMNPKTIDKLINDFSNEPIQKAHNN